MSGPHPIDDQAMPLRPWVVGVSGFGMFKDLPADMRHRVIEAHMRRARRLRAAALTTILRHLAGAAARLAGAAWAAAARDGDRARRGGSPHDPPPAPWSPTPGR